ncbi:MAG: hypothetical protein GF335_01260 [Candidatus Moranbacteria bacterium]|nr:hypothetical protein [Candidatus Moranbacteria bacterium]
MALDEIPGLEKLEEKYKLFKSPEVARAEKREERRRNIDGKNPLKHKKDPNSTETIQTYLNRFREILDRKDPTQRNQGIKAFKRWIHSRFVIKPEEVPEKWFKTQIRNSEKRGLGNSELKEEEKKEMIGTIIKDQKDSINEWIDYLSSDQNESLYPDWAKYWVLREVLSLTPYDRDEKKFKKRDQKTVASFPKLNPEALAYAIDWVLKYFNKKQELKSQDKDQKEIKQQLEDSLSELFHKTDLDEPQKHFFDAVKQLNFSKLYSYGMQISQTKEMGNLEKIKGKWQHYEQNSDPEKLTESLKNRGTQWCIAQVGVAAKYLGEGDVYIFFSSDDEKKNNQPRVGITIKNGQVFEVRGVGENQNLDPYITEVVEEKLKELPGGGKYFKKVEDMQRLTEIEEKHNNNQELKKEDLKFLYELNGYKIEGFGFVEDPRIEKIRNQRDIRKDYAKIYNVEEREVIFDLENLGEQTKVYIGNEVYVVPPNTNKERVLKLGEIFGLKADLTGLPNKIKDELIFWQGDLIDKEKEDFYYQKLTKVEGSINFPNYRYVNFNQMSFVGGRISCNNVKLLDCPELKEIGGDLSAPKAETVKCKQLKEIGGDLSAPKAETVKCKQLEKIGGDLSAPKAETIEIPQLKKTGGSLILEGLNEETITFDQLEEIGGHFKISLFKAVIANALKKVGGDINLGVEVKHFFATSLKQTGGKVCADSLVSFEAPKIEEIGGSFSADNLKDFFLPNLEKIGTKRRSLFGGIFVRNAKTIKAPKLQYLGGSLIAHQAIFIETPKLHTLEGDFEAGKVESLTLNKLQRSGSFSIPSATTFDAPKLRQVDGYLDALYCRIFTAPELKIINGYLTLPHAQAVDAPKLSWVSGAIYFPKIHKLKYKNINEEILENAKEILAID